VHNVAYYVPIYQPSPGPHAQTIPEQIRKPNKAKSYTSKLATPSQSEPNQASQAKRSEPSQAKPSQTIWAKPSQANFTETVTPAMSMFVVGPHISIQLEDCFAWLSIVRVDMTCNQHPVNTVGGELHRGVW
jgi:hypothetical protein